MRSIIYGSTVLLTCLVAGCSLPEWGSSLPEPRPLGDRFERYVPTTSTSPADTAQSSPASEIDEPTGKLTLRQALALSLLRSPDLASSAWSVRQAEAEQLQASLIPNPELETELGNFDGTNEYRDGESMETTIQVSQLIELGGKREKRMRLALADSRLSGWDYEANRVEVFTNVAQRFIDLLAVQERLALVRENLKLTRATLDAVKKRVEAGAAAPPEADRALVEEASGAIQVRRLERECAAVRQRLASTWGSTNARFDSVVGSLDELHAMPTLDALLPLLEQNPRLARWHDERLQRQAAVSLAKADAIPDLTVGVGYRQFHETNDRAAVAAVSIPLPIFSRNQGEIAKARFGVIKATLGERSTRAQVRAELEEAYQQMAAAYQESISLRDEVLPAATRAFNAFEKSYRQGKCDYLDVLDAQRALIQARGQSMESLASYQKAVTELEGLITQSIRDVDSSAPTHKEPEHE